MIFEVSEENINYVVDILNEAYRGDEGWTTEKELVSGNRASKEMIGSDLEKGYKYYILKEKDHYVGCFNIIQQENSVEIGGLGVIAGRQNSGIGKRLLSEAENVAAILPGVNRLVVSVLEPRKELIDFYMRRGYRKTALKYPFPADRGVGFPLVENLQVIILEKNA